jgi:hypothetical protein
VGFVAVRTAVSSMTVSPLQMTYGAVVEVRPPGG